ncbi:MAG: hypothetical protein K7J46_06960 [Bryobacter sp.]|nr:hypothetical protein [Bryobacter sp. CoA8 C33]
MNFAAALGHAPEELPLPLREALSGHWAAFELYSPARQPLRKIAALGPTPAACFDQLRSRGLDLTLYEVVQLPPAY